MALVFSPLADEVISLPPKRLFPRAAFVMRQIGEPPDIDRMMANATREVLEARGFAWQDAAASAGSKDFLERILGLIRATGFTVAIFSGETRGTALANIMLELGFAAMCGKPLMIVKSKGAAAPSDLTRTDWIEFDPNDVPEFRANVGKALDAVEDLASFERMMLDVAMDAPATDCGVAFERLQRAYLIDNDLATLDKLPDLLAKLDQANSPDIGDLQRLRNEINMFNKLARRSATSNP